MKNKQITLAGSGFEKYAKTTRARAPSSTKNASGERDPEMHQTKKGNQWFFGMKGHVGVDKKTKLIPRWRPAPSTCATATCCPSCFTGERNPRLGR
jgi:IS5 family transposase